MVEKSLVRSIATRPPDSVLLPVLSTMTVSELKDPTACLMAFALAAEMTLTVELETPGAEMVVKHLDNPNVELEGSVSLLSHAMPTVSAVPQMVKIKTTVKSVELASTVLLITQAPPVDLQMEEKSLGKSTVTRPAEPVLEHVPETLTVLAHRETTVWPMDCASPADPTLTALQQETLGMVMEEKSHNKPFVDLVEFVSVPALTTLVETSVATHVDKQPLTAMLMEPV